MAFMIKILIGCIEIWHAFATHFARQNVLVRINHCIDAARPQLIDKIVYLFQVSIIILSRSILNSFPHNSESDKVEAPLDHILDVLIVERVLRIKSCIVCGNIG